MTAGLIDRVRAGARLNPLVWLAAHSPATVPEPYAPYHRQLGAWPDAGARQARVVFRGAAKSTVTTGMILWAAYTGRTRGVVWVRAVESDCIADREAMERVGALAGMRVTVKAAEHLVLVNDVPIWTKTPKGAVRGIKHTLSDGTVVRPDTAVIDDIETRETARSDMQTKRLGRWLQSDLFATAGHKAPLRVIMLGTPITPSSLIAQAMRREAPFDTWAEPLIVPYLEDGQPAWPAMYDPELEGSTEAGAWACEYLLDPLPEGSLFFPPKRAIWRQVEAASVFVAVDPAGDGTDATGMAAVALTAHGLLVVDVKPYRGHSEQMHMAVGEFVRGLQARGHRVTAVSVEGVGGFVYAVPKIREQVAPTRVVTEVPVTSKTERAAQLAFWEQRDALAIADHLLGSEFATEFHTFTREGFTVTGHDDLVDAAVWAAGLATQGWRVKPPAKTWAAVPVA